MSRHTLYGASALVAGAAGGVSRQLRPAPSLAIGARPAGGAGGHLPCGRANRRRIQAASSDKACSVDPGDPFIAPMVLDVYAPLNGVVADPGTHGFLNATDACLTLETPPYACKQPDRTVFWAGIHPTQALHAIVAQQAIVVMSAP